MITLWISVFENGDIGECGFLLSYYKVIKRVFHTLFHKTVEKCIRNIYRVILFYKKSYRTCIIEYKSTC